jgi:hypothetical protein
MVRAPQPVGEAAEVGGGATRAARLVVVEEQRAAATAEGADLAARDALGRQRAPFEAVVGIGEHEVAVVDGAREAGEPCASRRPARDVVAVVGRAGQQRAGLERAQRALGRDETRHRVERGGVERAETVATIEVADVAAVVVVLARARPAIPAHAERAARRERAQHRETRGASRHPARAKRAGCEAADSAACGTPGSNVPKSPTSPA